MSREAGANGAQAAEVKAASAAVAAGIAELSRRIVHVVRTATEDADRRRDPRVTTDLPCTLALQHGVRQTARLRNVSASGAEIVGASDLAPGTTGMLELRQEGGIAVAAFTVRPGGTDAALHVAFEAGNISTEFRRMLERLAPQLPAAA